MAQQTDWDERVIQFGQPVGNLDPSDLYIEGEVVFEISATTIAHRFIVGEGFARTTVQILYYTSV